jgi:hypothetical protein
MVVGWAEFVWKRWKHSQRLAIGMNIKLEENYLYAYGARDWHGGRQGNSHYLEITWLEQRKIVGWHVVHRSCSWWHPDQTRWTLLHKHLAHKGTRCLVHQEDLKIEKKYNWNSGRVHRMRAVTGQQTWRIRSWLHRDSSCSNFWICQRGHRGSSTGENLEHFDG